MKTICLARVNKILKIKIIQQILNSTDTKLIELNFLLNLLKYLLKIPRLTIRLFHSSDRSYDLISCTAVYEAKDSRRTQQAALSSTTS